MLDLGAVGKLLIFFMTAIGLTFLSILVFTYAAYSLLVTLVNTAAGTDEVDWPGEPLQDNLWLLAYLGWVVAVWAVPVDFVLRCLGVEWLSRTAVVVGCLWFFFPFSLLSSLCSQSRWMIFRPAIIVAFLNQTPAVIGFYLSTAPLFALCTWLFYVGAVNSVAVVPVAGAVGAVGLLIYARLLGRLGWRLSHTGLGKGRNDKSGEASVVRLFDPWSDEDGEEEGELPRHESTEASTEHNGPRGQPKRLQAYDPWKEPENEPEPQLPKPVLSASGEEDPLGPISGTYDIAADSVAPTQPAQEKPGLDSGIETYALAPPAELPAMPPPATPQVSKIEEALESRREPPPPPRVLLFSGVYTFPFYSTSLSALLVLALGLTGIGALLHVLIQNWPDALQ
jgi:hypothetical protein